MKMSSIFAVLVGIALAGLLAALGTGLVAMGAAAAEPLTLHRGLALAGTILVVFTHSIVFVYMIGTGRAIKDAVRDHGIERHHYDEHVGYKWRAAPWATACATSTLATAVLGGVVETGAAATWIHPLVATAAVLLNFLGLPAEYRTIRDNGLLLDRVAEATADRNREKIERGEDPAPPLSPLSPSGWSLVFAASSWLPWLYIRFIMGRSDLPWWPFAAVCGLFLFGALRNRGAATACLEDQAD